MTKKELSNHIHFQWKFQLLGILVAFIISLISIQVASTPTKKEKIAIFLTCFMANERLNEYVDSIKPDYLEIIELNIRHKEDTYYGTVIKGYYKTADIIIVPESKTDYIITKDCLALNDEIVDKLTAKDYEYYKKDDNNYGLKVYSKDSNTGILSDLVIFDKEDKDEDYYLFISNKSVHLGEFNNSHYAGLIYFLKEILNYEAKSSN